MLLFVKGAEKLLFCETYECEKCVLYTCFLKQVVFKKG